MSYIFKTLSEICMKNKRFIEQNYTYNFSYFSQCIASQPESNLLKSLASREQICPGLTLIRCMPISISVTKCLIALLLNFNITRFPEY